MDQITDFAFLWWNQLRRIIGCNSLKASPTRNHKESHRYEGQGTIIQEVCTADKYIQDAHKESTINQEILSLEAQYHIDTYKTWY